MVYVLVRCATFILFYFFFFLFSLPCALCCMISIIIIIINKVFYVTCTAIMRRSLQALSLIVVTIIVFVTYTMFDVHMLMRRISIHYFSPKVSFHYLSSNILVYFIYGDQTTVQRKRLINVCRRDASSHIIWCKMSLSSLKLLTFFWNSRWWPPPSWIFSLCEFGHSGVLIVWYLCSVLNLVQISVIVTEIDAHIIQTFIWWRHTN